MEEIEGRPRRVRVVCVSKKPWVLNVEAYRRANEMSLSRLVTDEKERADDEANDSYLSRD
jgi:hypothetical protein